MLKAVVIPIIIIVKILFYNKINSLVIRKLLACVANTLAYYCKITVETM